MAPLVSYIFMIRGINVGGHKIVKMDALRKSFEKLGFKDARTYVQSGNVVVKAAKQAAAALEEKVKKQILKDFGHEVSVMVRSAEEMEAVVRANPFAKDASNDVSRLHVTFLSGVPEGAAVKLLGKIPAGADQYRCCEREIYLYCPSGYGESKLSNNALEKALARRATTRNWNTVNKLREMAGE
jgi:uncharacterized protein (DUF1697 family)